MCNAVIHFRVLKKKGRLIDGDGSEGAPEGGERWRAHGKCCDSDTSSMQRVAGIKKKQLILMYTGYFTLDSPSVYLQTFISLPTVCARVRLACMCVCVCVLISIFLAIPSICYSLGFFALSVLSENLLFFYCRKSG